jgi:hypothetical protein
VFAALLQRRRQTQELLGVETGMGKNIHERGFALCEGAGFIHHEGGDFLQPFERFGILHEDAILRAASDADHDGHGSCQTKGAGAGDDQDRDSAHDGVCESWFRPEPHPKNEGDHRNSQYDRHENTRHFVGKTLNGRTAPLRVGNHIYDLPEQGIAANSLRAHDEGAGAIDGACRHFIAHCLLHGERFAGDHGLFHAGVTFYHRAIDGHFVTRNHAQPIADLHLIERDS